MRESDAIATIRTPLGDVRLRASGGVGIVIAVETPAIPALPSGMSVDGVALATVSLPFGVADDHPLSLRVEADGDAAAETGEWLESMSFRHAGGGVVQVAIRDGEWLAGRGITADEVDYGTTGFRQIVRRAPAGGSLHVGVAWRATPNGEQDASSWFAADLALPDRPGVTSPAA